jgi:hypothetical protein
VNDPTGGNTTGGNTTGGNTTGGNVTVGGNVGVNLGEERRYLVEISNFIVLDETGCDYCGSDEVAFIIRTADYALLTSTYEDVDSPAFWENQQFYLVERCALPAVDVGGYDHNWECDQTGKAAPLSFTIAAWEDDGDIIFTGFCSNQPVDAPSPDIWLPGKSFCVEDRGELIGKVKIEFKTEDLNDLQSPGQYVDKEIDLTGGCDLTKIDTCGDSAPHYRLRYRVTRVRDATGGSPVDPNP